MWPACEADVPVFDEEVEREADVVGSSFDLGFDVAFWGFRDAFEVAADSLHVAGGPELVAVCAWRLDRPGDRAGVGVGLEDEFAGGRPLEVGAAVAAGADPASTRAAATELLAAHHLQVEVEICGGAFAFAADRLSALVAWVLDDVVDEDDGDPGC
jgi:hypothetical protein